MIGASEAAMIELIHMALIGGLLGTGLALIGIPQRRVFDGFVLCNGVLLLVLLTGFIGA
jgi:hypothetical protein